MSINPSRCVYTKYLPPAIRVRAMLVNFICIDLCPCHETQEPGRKASWQTRGEMKLVLGALSASVAYGWISPTAIHRQSTMLHGSIAPKGEEEEKEKSRTIVNFKANKAYMSRSK